MSGYIMAGPDEPQRIRAKTDALLIRHHLDWIGLSPSQSFVDFGCATGEVLREATAMAGDALMVGLDADRQMLVDAASAPTGGLGRVHYVQTTIAGPDSTPLASDTFNHAWCRFLLEYHPDALGVIEEMRRVVRPQGKVNLIDIEGNGIWHFPFPDSMRADLDEVIADLALTGFDPLIGGRLADLARKAGLVDIRESIEPYHRIVGRPDGPTAEAWKRKILGLKESYVGRLFPHKAHKAAFFDRYLEFILDEGTMTWSLLHLVQGTKP